jgi:hypothetical protein
VEHVASRLSGAAGPSGVDATDLSNWLLRFGKESAALREELASWANWLSNASPPWAAYRALMACRLVALDKQPGVRPVGIGESYRRLIAKCVIAHVGHQATAACDNLNLCAGLAAGIEGAIHAVRETMDQPADESLPTRPANPTAGETAMLEALDQALTQPPDVLPAEEEDGDEDMHLPLKSLLLVDARNGFNELGRKAMLWTVRHRWARGARFAFNCYRHAAKLILRRRGQDCELLLSCEGVTQGDPISMILYGLALVPLAESMRRAVPDLVQLWYADDAAMAGEADKIAKATRLLEVEGPARGYFPEPAKSILICSPAVREDVQTELREFNFQYRSGARYLGGYIGTPEAKQQWLAPQIQKWVDGVEALARVAVRYPQAAYAGMVRSFQMEWQYLQRICPGISDEFHQVEAAVTKSFLPALLGDKTATPAALREVIALSVRRAGMGIPDPSRTADRQYSASKEVTAQLTASLVKRERLGTATYLAGSADARKDTRKKWQEEEEAAFQRITSAASKTTARQMTRSRDTGTWLTVMPSTLNGTELSADEFRDSLRLRLGLSPIALPKRCEGCGDRFTVEHAMACQIGGHVSIRHNDVKAEWHHLCAQALKPSSITDEPLIHSSQDVRKAGQEGSEPPKDLRGDVAAHGFWKSGITAVFDVRVTDTDQPSYKGLDPAKVLAQHERQKKAKYNELCLARRRTFTPLVFSVDGMRGTEASAACKRLSSLLSAKWARHYSEVCGYVHAKIAISLVRSTSRCLRTDRKPLVRRPTTGFDTGTGLALF